MKSCSVAAPLNSAASESYQTIGWLHRHHDPVWLTVHPILATMIFSTVVYSMKSRGRHVSWCQQTPEHRVAPVVPRRLIWMRTTKFCLLQIFWARSLSTVPEPIDGQIEKDRS